MEERCFCGSQICLRNDSTIYLETTVKQVMRKVDLIRKNMVKSVRNERNILAMTNNPFVVSFYYSFTNASNLYIVMEYCNGGDCYNLLKGLGCMSEGVARLYTAETVLALEYCHTKVIFQFSLTAASSQVHRLQSMLAHPI